VHLSMLGGSHSALALTPARISKRLCRMGKSSLPILWCFAPDQCARKRAALCRAGKGEVLPLNDAKPGARHAHQDKCNVSIPLLGTAQDRRYRTERPCHRLCPPCSDLLAVNALGTSSAVSA